MPLVHFQQDDLFAEPSDATGALREFQRSLELWLDTARTSGRLARDSSIETYRDLWSVVTKWALGQEPPVHLAELTEADLESLIASRSGAAGAGQDLSLRYVWRLLHLVERVLANWARVNNLPSNDAVARLLANHPEWRFANAARADPLPEYLDAAQAKQLVAYLSQARPRPGGRAIRMHWHELRNRASVGLQLGAGLTPGEVRAVQLDGVRVQGGRSQGVPWKIQVPAGGVTPVRETPIAPWAGQLLAHWLQVRKDVSVAGSHLFPSTKTGKPWGKIAQYLASKQVLLDAGLSSEEASGGSFRMRHTFALRQLRKGTSPDEVARWLGVVDPAVMTRYQRVLQVPVAGVV